MLDVVETFVSINGEGMKAGQLAFFLRLKGCNLRCSYCDTMWANDGSCEYKSRDTDDIYEEIKASGIKNVTVTGGEPLYREGVSELLELIAKDDTLSVEIETNGSIYLKPFMDIDNRPSMTMDYKLPSSGMEKYMCRKNFELLDMHDTVKFVSGTPEDLERAKEIIDEYGLIGKCNILFSPVFGRIKPEEIVEFMKKNKLNGTAVQLQLHKYIWAPDKRGV